MKNLSKKRFGQSMEYKAFFQTTLDKINRADDVENMRYWIRRTKEKGLNVCGHLIYGLPDENEK